MSIDDFHMLTRDSFIWQEKIVYFRLPKGINSLSEYYYGIRHNITNLQQKDIEERINRLNTIFEKGDRQGGRFCCLVEANKRDERTVPASMLY